MTNRAPARGNIFLATLDPTMGSEQAGRRPVLIVSRNAINQSSSIVICVPLSDRSNFRKIYPSQVEIAKGSGGLRLASVAMCEQIRAITVDRLGKLYGSVGEPEMRQVDLALKITLNLT